MRAYLRDDDIDETRVSGDDSPGSGRRTRPRVAVPDGPVARPAPALSIAPRRLPRDRGAALVRATRAEFLAGRQALLIDLLAELLDAPDCRSGLDELAGLLQRRFECERVAVALVRGGRLVLGSVSQQGVVDPGGAEARLLLDAMDAALVAERTLSWPMDDPGAGVPTALRTLAGRRDDTPLASVPMYLDGAPAGALLLERRDGAPFAPRTLELLERIALVVCPLLVLRREAEQGAFTRLRRAVADRLRWLFGAERTGARAGVVALGIVLLAGLVVPVPHRVVADAELVPSVRRLVTAPVTGFVEEVLVTAGERVVPGQVLARLDRRDLELDAVRYDNEIRAAQAEFRSAMASHDRRETAMAGARLERTRALRALVERRLERSELRAPIGGLVIGADPLDATGAPVERGERLFEIAPADGYEVHLLVDESDVREVVPGQHGTLSLKARPGQGLAFAVRSIHPVAESEGGATRFRVRADLEAVSAAGPGAPRPGESGTARLEAGRTSALGALTAPLRRRLEALWWRLAG